MKLVSGLPTLSLLGRNQMQVDHQCFNYVRERGVEENMQVCLLVCTCAHVPVEARKGSQSMSHLMWVLEPKLVSSARAVCALDW